MNLETTFTPRLDGQLRSARIPLLESFRRLLRQLARRASSLGSSYGGAAVALLVYVAWITLMLALAVGTVAGG